MFTLYDYAGCITFVIQLGVVMPETVKTQAISPLV